MSTVFMQKNMVCVSVIFFGPLKDFFKSGIRMELPAAATVQALRDQLISQNHSSESVLLSSRAVIKDEFVEWSRTIQEGDEIFFLPPASGG